jgi:acyl transferase domain-containing protein
MLATGLSIAEAEALIYSFGMQDRINVAAVNSPSATTLSGDVDDILYIKDIVAAKGKLSTVVRIEGAFHSHHMDDIKNELLENLSDITSSEANIPLFSTVTGSQVLFEEGNQILGSDYWWRNVRQPVLFAQAIKRIHQTIKRPSNKVIWIELAPNPTLSSYIKECVTNLGGGIDAVTTCQKRKSDDIKFLLESVMLLHKTGYPKIFYSVIHYC